MRHETRARALVALLAGGFICVAAACGSARPSSSARAPENTAPTATASSPTAAPCSLSAVLATWSDERLAQQTVVVPVDEAQVGAAAGEVAAGAGGVILFGSSAPANLAPQLQSLAGTAPGGIAPFVMTDEEGGDVQRMANVTGSLPAPRQMGATMTPAQIQQLAAGAATRMRASGVTMDLAPVLDTDDGAGPNNSDPDGTRSFSNDSAVASRDGRAFAAGLIQGGVVPVVKHFPGLGHSTGNTDVTSAATLPWKVLQTDGVLPFRDAVAAHLPAVMVANATVPGLSSIPASLSPDVIENVLRGQLGFQGLVLTDSLSAVAIKAAGYSMPQAAVVAIAAGADMVLFDATASQLPALHQNIVNAIAAAVLTRALPRARLLDAAGHILTAKGVDLCHTTAPGA